jgi:nitrogen fixation/metabolism regulation signal transduction histidine kinase
MVFERFRVQIAMRVALLAGLVIVTSWSLPNTNWWATPLITGTAALLVLVELVRYVESVNRELARFLDFVAHGDFSPSFPVAAKGRSFRELETAYAVLASRFRSLNLEKAANHRYLEALVEHVNTAILCFDEHGVVTLMNREAQRLFRLPHLGSIRALRQIDRGLLDSIERLEDGGHALVRVMNAGEPLHLALFATEFELLGRRFKLISLQNIRDELEQREADYSRKLIRVLTHEIMNSVTPIVSLTRVIEDRIVNPVTGEISTAGLTSEERHDLRRSFDTIESRGGGLLSFVQTYSALSDLPRPSFANVAVADLFERIETLLRPSLVADGCRFETRCAEPDMTVTADAQQIEQVLINLIRNAAEAVKGKADGEIALRAVRDAEGRAQIEVADNGTGIDPAQLDDIFVPFFTTKRKGGGIGLSISRQIMLLNRGSITVRTTPGRGSVFALKFR